MRSFSHNSLSWSGPSIICGILLVAGCGGSGGGDGGSTFADGVFLDSPVEGLWYEVGTLEEFTDADGGFSYLLGRPIAFYLGDIRLGSAIGAPVLTPLDMVGANNVADSRVTNMIRFLQTLDDDYDPSNGIRIAASTHQALLEQNLSFDVPINDFANDGDVRFLIAAATASLGQPRMLLVPEITAQAHMRATLVELDSPGQTPPLTLGTLGVSGQQGTIGNQFTPDPVLSFSSATFGSRAVEWNEPRPGPAQTNDQDTAVRMDLRFNASPAGTQVTQLSLTWESQFSRSSHGVTCSGPAFAFELDLASCAGIVISLDAGTVTFNGVTLRLAAQSTPTLTLNGTLTIP